MTKRPFISLILCFSFICLIAQNNFKQGHIIKNDGNTVNGLINFRTDELNCKQCVFKETETSAEQTFKPFDIKGYKLDKEGLYYTSVEAVVDNVSVNIFAQFLVQGEMNLYYYVDGNERPFYLFENRDLIEDRKMIAITKKPNEIIESKILVDNRYQGVLRYMFRDYNGIAEKTGDLKFTQKEMIDLSKKYHDAVCKTGEECIIYEDKNPDKDYIKTSFEVGLGYASFPDKLFEAKGYSGASVSVAINIHYPRISDITYTQVGLKYNIVDAKNSDRMGLISLFFGQRVNLSKSNFIPFLEGGMSMIYSTDNYGMCLSIYGAGGLKHKLKTNNYISLQLGFENYFVSPWENTAVGWNAKLGYTF